MDSYTQSALDIVAETGDKFSKLDMIEIDFLLTLGPVDDAYERRGMVLEAVNLIITDPLYKGDITSIEDDD
jgi:hypothetical protein